MTKEISNSDKAKITLLFGACCFVLGVFCGAIVWIALKVINVLTKLIWDILPQAICIDTASIWGLFFNIAICAIGAFVVALIIHKWGFMPHTAEEALEIFKKRGTYPYDNIPLLAFCAIVPLIFGATLGPEAGLMGLIIGLCCWVGDSLKIRAKKLLNVCRINAGEREIESFKDAVVCTGSATVLTIVFATPLAGIVNNLETEILDKETGHKALGKASRSIIYILGVVGAILAFSLLNAGYKILCEMPFLTWMYEEGGLPRFPQLLEFDWMHIVWFIPLVVAGIILGCFSLGLDNACIKITAPIKKKNVHDGNKMTYPGALMLTMTGAIILAVFGYFYPIAMFSGEHQLGPLMQDYQHYVWWGLIVIAVIKISLATICFNFGWKGGLIFPIIFSGVAVGLGLSMVFGVNGFYAAAVTCAATYAMHAKKPATVVAILLLVFPVTYLPYTVVSAVIASALAKKITNSN